MCSTAETLSHQSQHITAAPAYILFSHVSVCYSVSPFGATPRSARSDHNVKSIEDELEDEIEEDLSVAEDLLRSDNSGVGVHNLVTACGALAIEL